MVVLTTRSNVAAVVVDEVVGHFSQTKVDSKSIGNSSPSSCDLAISGLEPGNKLRKQQRQRLKLPHLKLFFDFGTHHFNYILHNDNLTTSPTSRVIIRDLLSIVDSINFIRKRLKVRPTLSTYFEAQHKSGRSLLHNRKLYIDICRLTTVRTSELTKEVSLSSTVVSNRSMGQRQARLAVESGVSLYHSGRHEEAITKWSTALKSLKAPHERFITLGYLTQAYGETGHFKAMLTHALCQIDLANEQNDSYMRAEAYLNLARANEKSCEYYKAIAYGRHCLANRSQDPRTPGYAHLCMAYAYYGFSRFPQALESFELAMQVAHAAHDRLLELQICTGLGYLFSTLKDTGKASLFLENAKRLLETIRIQDVYAKYLSLINYHLSYVVMLHGNLETAQALCQEALQLSNTNGNRPIVARCLIQLGDIFSHSQHNQEEALQLSNTNGNRPIVARCLIQLGDIFSHSQHNQEKCWENYETGYRMMLEIGDRFGQMKALAAMSKCAIRFKSSQFGQCECQAIELNRKCLEIAKAIGCKFGQMKCHLRLQQLYSTLTDDDNEESDRVAVTKLIREMETFCNFCGQRYATNDEQRSLQALPCSHIFHESCLTEYLKSATSPADVECPKCLKASNDLPSTSEAL